MVGVPSSEAFDPRSNSIAFLRWLFAAAVVVSHSLSIGGFRSDNDPLVGWSHGQASIGSVAVDGFFVLSGFLVTRSWYSTGSTVRFLWHRVLRVFPAYWVCLIVTAFVLAPIVWNHEYGGLTGVFHVSGGVGPFGYVNNNFFLWINQWDIGPLFVNTPYAHSGLPLAWDGSLWTLIYEFRCYGVLAVLGAAGLLRGRITVTLLCLAGWLTLLNGSWGTDFAAFLNNSWIVPLGFVFGLGALVALYSDRIRIDDRLGVLAVVVMIWTIAEGGWTAVGSVSFAYLVIWAAVRIPIRHWDRFGDLSYGTYIWAFPFQMMLTEWSFQRHGLIPFVFASLALATAAAFVSWHLVEKHALRLKRWSPSKTYSRVQHSLGDADA
jgi:peptidoglycan/LPS O-acetylase OafA/YrhL